MHSWENQFLKGQELEFGFEAQRQGCTRRKKKMLARPIHSCKGSRNYYELTWEAIIDCVCGFDFNRITL